MGATNEGPRPNAFAMAAIRTKVIARGVRWRALTCVLKKIAAPGSNAATYPQTCENREWVEKAKRMLLKGGDNVELYYAQSRINLYDAFEQIC